MEVEGFPDELLEKILSFYSYDEISRLRLVCKKFDRCCQSLLNQGFLKVERFHAQCLRNVKARLPRRESERRTHLLARHCDILTAIETRLSLLGMTFMKYVDMNLCCFIPGKVIDEIYRVLRYIQNTTSPPRAHEILQELRDISSMAMEHFDEKIAPTLKQKIGAASPSITITPQGTYTVPGSPSSYACSSRPMSRSIALREEITKMHQFIKQLSCANGSLKKEVANLKAKVNDQRKKLREQAHVIADQGARLAEQDGKINEINRKLLEYDRRFAEMTELNRSGVGTSSIVEPQPFLPESLMLLPNLQSCDEHSTGLNDSPPRESCSSVPNLELSEPNAFVEESPDSPEYEEASTSTNTEKLLASSEQEDEDESHVHSESETMGDVESVPLMKRKASVDDDEESSSKRWCTERETIP